MSDHTFCRLLLRETRRPLTTAQSRRLVGAWSYLYRLNGAVRSGEFNVPKDSYYWHGSCCCAYHARAQGITAWLERYYPEENQDSEQPNDERSAQGDRL